MMKMNKKNEKNKNPKQIKEEIKQIHWEGGLLALIQNLEKEEELKTFQKKYQNEKTILKQIFC